MSLQSEGRTLKQVLYHMGLNWTSERTFDPHQRSDHGFYLQFKTRHRDLARYKIKFPLCED